MYLTCVEVRAVVGSEEHNDVCDFLRFSVALVQIGRCEYLVGFFLCFGIAESVALDTAHHIGVDGTGVDAVDMNAVGAKLCSRGLYYCLNGVLGGAVDAHAGTAEESAVGGGDDDGTVAVCLEIGSGVLYHVQDAKNVDSEDIVEIFGGDVLQQSVIAFITGIGDNNVDLAEVLVSTVDKSLDLVLLGNVGDVCVNAILAIAKFLDQSVNLFLVSAGESDLAAFLQKFLAACFADASVSL